MDHNRAHSFLASCGTLRIRAKYLRRFHWVELDGGWLPSWDRPGGMEGKVGVIATQVDALGKQGRHRLSSRRSVATFGPAEEVDRFAYAAACGLGASEAPEQIVLENGAGWIKTQAYKHFPEAVKI